MLRRFKADLHVHTCLSPCGDLSMGPLSIVAKAAQRGLDVIGISDHNSSENTPAVVRAARGKNVTVLPGMEITSKEEVHLLALFDSVDKALQLQEIIYEHLHGENDAEAFGLQVVVNENHDVLAFNGRLLAGATDLSVEQVVDTIHRLDGLAIASHIDRETFGIIGQLGFIPEALPLDALELTRNTSLEEAQRRFSQYGRRAFVRSSDAHCLDDIGAAATSFLLSEATVAEIKKALLGKEGRRVVTEKPGLLREGRRAFG